MVLFSIKAKLTGAKPSSETQNKLNLKKAKQVVYLLDFFLNAKFYFKVLNVYLLKYNYFMSLNRVHLINYSS